MNDITDVITKALSQYDELSSKYDSFKKATTSKLHKDSIKFYKNNQLVHESQYNIIGLYDSILEKWTWGWAYPMALKKHIVSVKQLLLYGLDIDADRINMLQLKKELITSELAVNKTDRRVFIDIHIALASYLLKKYFVHAYKSKSDNKTYYYFIDDLPNDLF